MNLYELGWDASFAEAFAPYERDGLIPARVAARHHGPCELLTGRGRLGGMPAGRLSRSGLPAVGDWVAARPLAGERRALIEAVLPRRTAFRRKEAWRRSVEQVVAANVDTVFLLTAFGHDLSPRRLERYLTAAADSGAEPVVVVNKLDLAARPGPGLDALEAVAGGAPVLAVSAATGQGLAALEAWLSRGATVALLGSSGVGKSTLANALLGRPLLPTAPTSAGGRGRHTTSRRDLVLLPCGALLLDTPGMRELQLWSDEGALDASFGEIAELAGACRFADCTHEHEPGCAVREAVPPGRLAGYRKLHGELRTLATRRGGR
ncbi:MAG TPA: ribosome small subunit-dependent GTPase A [Gaiellaceae bacterium]|nr:ribosome small subunit-dependent GTPase A [Gaiellaceae bacterium]